VRSEPLNETGVRFRSGGSGKIYNSGEIYLSPGRKIKLNCVGVFWWTACLKSTFWPSKFIEFTRCNPSLIRSTNARLNGCRSPFRTNRPKPTTIVVFAATVFDQTDGQPSPGDVFFGTGENQHTLPVEKTVRIVQTALSPSLSNSVFKQTQ
jgi:hypothetical protein